MMGVEGAHLEDLNERDAQATIEIALQGGVRFFDTTEMDQKLIRIPAIIPASKIKPSQTF